MNKNNVLQISAILMFILAVIIITLGITTGPKVLLPPVVTGVGFFVIAWVFMSLREK